jgi:hypothetical protein
MFKVLATCNEIEILKIYKLNGIVHGNFRFGSHTVLSKADVLFLFELFG